ncbi:probable plastid-lipid-associated protein 11, chloroplastic [Zingiber officinale]|nr:probable plastid-lipid-associated protein 11, chloroplastic [Zingiber officinale]
MATMPSSLPRLLSLRFPRPNPRGFGNPPPPQALAGGATSLEAKADLLTLIADQDRGLRTQSDPAKRARIVAAISALGEIGGGQITTGPSLSGTWRMLWTTEKEQLFIIKGTKKEFEED